MKSKLRYIIPTFLLLLLMLCLISCGRNEYTVTLDTNGGSLSVTEQAVTHGKTYVLPTPTYDGRRFEGWYYNDSLVDNYGKWNYKENITLVAKWSYAEYTITYELNGGVADNPTSYTFDTDDFVISVPTKEGYIFECWTDSKGNKHEGEITIPKGSQGDLILTAVWWDFKDENYEYRLENGELTVIKLLSLPKSRMSVPAYVKGLPVVKLGDSLFEGLGPILDDPTIHYTPKILIPETIKEIGVNTFKDCNGVGVALADVSGKEIFDYTYIRLDTWSEKVIVNDGNGEFLRIITQRRPAFGWSDFSAAKYRVRFKTNCEATVEDILVIYNTSYTLPVPKRDGYTFVGWYYNDRLIQNEGKWAYRTLIVELEAVWTKVE